MSTHPSVVGDGDLGWSEYSHGEKFAYRRKQLGSSAGGEKLGCSLYEVPPGRRAWPYHYHLANEEAIYVLEGSGTLRIGGEEIRVSKGDYVDRQRNRGFFSGMVRGVSDPREGTKILTFLFRPRLVCSPLLHLRSS